MKPICKNLNLLASHYPSITEFAKHIGFSRQTVGFWLADQRTPTAEAITAICEKEEVSADWLLGITPYSKIRREALADLQKAIKDINPIEIASHIADGTLETWCNTIRDYMEGKVEKL